MVSRLVPVRLKPDTTYTARTTVHVVSAFRRTFWFALAATFALAGDARAQPFQVEEATIAGIHAAMVAKRLTSVELVRLYLNRIKAYNGTCVQQPEGLLKV